jgi:lysophospholipase L1-like esterase
MLNRQNRRLSILTGVAVAAALAVTWPAATAAAALAGHGSAGGVTAHWSTTGPLTTAQLSAYQARPRPLYVAFGDSLTTGFSIPACHENRDLSPWGCIGASTNAPPPALPYPDKVATALGYSWTDLPSAYRATAPNPPPYDLDRVGIWGYTAAQAYTDFKKGHNQVGPWEPQFTAVMHAHDLVTGELGINDLQFSNVQTWLVTYLSSGSLGVRQRAQIMLNGISVQLHTMFQSMRFAHSHGATAVVTLVYNPYSATGIGCGPVHNIAQAITDTLDSRLAELAHTYGVLIADFRPAFIGHAAGDHDHYTFGTNCSVFKGLWDLCPAWLCGGGGVQQLAADFDPHPNNKGTTAMADAILKVLRSSGAIARLLAAAPRPATEPGNKLLDSLARNGKRP